MKKPTELEVKLQFTLKGCTDESQYKKFLAYYYSVGWYVGKSKMRSWKAAVSGWILNKYSATKMATTALASAYVGEIPILTLRPFTNYGPMEDSSRFIFTVIKKSLQGEEIRVAPNINRDFVYVKDVARAYLLASRVGHSDGEVINIGSGVRHTLTEVAREIVKLTKSKSEIIEDEVFLRPKDSRCWADITRANKLLRWKPKYTRINGLKETISWLKKDLH